MKFNLSALYQSLTKPFRAADTAQLFFGGAAQVEEVMKGLDLYGSKPVARSTLRTMMADDKIYQCVVARLSAIASTDYEITCDSEDLKELVIDGVERVKAQYIKAVMEARWVGYSVVNLLVGENAEGVFVSGVVSLRQDDYLIKDGILTIANQAATTEQKTKLAELIDSGAVFCAVNAPTDDRPHGDAIFRVLYYTWASRRHADEQWDRAIDRFGTPFIMVKLSTPDEVTVDASGQQSTMIADVARALDSARRGSSIVLSKEDEASLLETTLGGKPFQDRIETLDRRIQLALLGQELSSSSGAGYGLGGGSAAAIQNEVRKEFTNADLEFLLPYMEHLVKFICENNNQDPAGVKFVWSKASELHADLAARDAIIAQLLASSGSTLSIDYITRAYNLSPADVTKQLASYVPPTLPAAKLSLSGLPTAKSAASAHFNIDLQTEELSKISAVDAKTLESLIQKAASPADLALRLSTALSTATVEEYATAMRNARAYAAALGGAAK